MEVLKTSRPPAADLREGAGVPELDEDRVAARGRRQDARGGAHGEG